MTREDIIAEILRVAAQLTPEDLAEVVNEHKKMTAPGWTPETVGADKTQM